MCIYSTWNASTFFKISVLPHGWFLPWGKQLLLGGSRIHYFMLPVSFHWRKLTWWVRSNHIAGHTCCVAWCRVSILYLGSSGSASGCWWNHTATCTIAAVLVGIGIYLFTITCSTHFFFYKSSGKCFECNLMSIVLVNQQRQSGLSDLFAKGWQ